MQYLKDTIFYQEAIQEINYDFGNYYLFETFVIGEVNEDVVYTWKHHGKKVVEELSHIYDNNGKNLVYITNRVNAYSVVPSDWINFFRLSYSLRAYAVVSNNPTTLFNSALEKLFMRSRMKKFKSLEEAIVWAKNLASEDKKTA
ncbi:hypothetical protein [Aquimarina intermedia]|uniref:SpoIIAA-like protein n=1 Tax=Aquimarina intermedia TaxID=350814 RepID=A0A5S5BYN4_9FLAO|nr:hypothetical protein [Aquimarina intermedia]TYP72154.1 hypothetical protein BD809_10738 [Aquimarina intermedia]